MVAHATTSPLPLLSPEDKRLLRIYFRVGQSIPALADELITLEAIHRADSPHSSLPTPHSPPPDEFDLATWATSETIAPHIAFRKQELADARREEALKELSSLVKHSDDALERRRAATTLLRMLSTQLFRTKREPSPPPPLGTPPLRGGFPSSPAAGTGGGRGARAAGGEGSVPTPPTNAPFTSDTQPNTTASDRNSPSLASPPPDPCPPAPPSCSHLGPSGSSLASAPDSRPSAAAPHRVTPSPLHPLTPLSDLFSTGDLPTPPNSPLPSPSRTPAELIQLTQDLIQHRTDDSLLTLYNLHGPITNRTHESFHQFKTCNCNSLAGAWNFLSSTPAPINQTPEGLETSIPIKLKNQNPRRLIIKLRFQRKGPLAGCWLLDGLYCFHPPRNTS